MIFSDISRGVVAINNIDKNKPIPIYYQIKEDIILQIKDNKLKANDRLPTEKWFIQHYGASRVTIRKAFGELIAEGILERVKCKGCIVAKPKFSRQLSKLTSTTEDMSNAGMKSSSIILSFTRELSSGEISKFLKIEDGEHLIVIHKIRFTNDQTLADQIIYLREKFCNGLDRKILQNRSLYDILESDFNLKLDYGEQIIDVSMPTSRQMKDLALHTKIPLLHSRRITYLNTGDTIEFSDNYYISDRYKYSVTLYR